MCSIAQSWPMLCDLTDYRLPVSSVHGVISARILEWVAIFSFKYLPNPGMEPMSPASLALAGGVFTTQHHITTSYKIYVICVLKFNNHLVTVV